MTALTLGLTAAIRSRCAWVTSRLDAHPSEMSRPSPTALICHSFALLSPDHRACKREHAHAEPLKSNDHHNDAEPLKSNDHHNDAP